MRHRVKISDKDLYHEIEAALRENQVRIFAASPRRGLLSTEPLPEDLASFIQEHGGSVTPEYQYNMEPVRSDRTRTPRSK
jgi:hypothetical protein